MTAAIFIEWATLISLVLLGLALLVSLVRIVIGPTLSDRVLALDLLTVVAMGFVGAIAVSGLGFLATVALARYVLLRGARNEVVAEES